MFFVGEGFSLGGSVARASLSNEEERELAKLTSAQTCWLTPYSFHLVTVVPTRYRETRHKEKETGLLFITERI